MKYFFAIVCILITVTLSGSLKCTIKYYDTNKLLNDYTTEGFLDRDHYQVITTGKPDKGSKGLVASRESALKNAKAIMNDKIIESLVNYNLNYHINKLKIKNVNDIKNLTEVKIQLSEKFQDFFQYGNTAFEYYNFDNSAVLVYRLFQDDLIEKVESIKPSLMLKNDKKETKAASSG
ncbi:MAG: hypothetical protein JXN64_11810 [Spirochaetes bacterium]|nr:hypothetical protein [Spirochaetota bacterium]